MKGIIWIRIAVLYFVFAVIFGMAIGITQQFQLTTVHAHANLLGWVSLALAGIIYHLFPKASVSVLGKCHFWLHNIGLPLMVVGLYVRMMELAPLPLIEIGGMLAIIGILLFAVNVFANMKEASVTNKSSSGKSLDQ